MAVRSRFLMIAISVLLLSMIFVQETEARRKILRGRKTITRTYYRRSLNFNALYRTPTGQLKCKEQSAIPAWAVVAIVGIGLLLLGGGVYVAMDKLFLGDLSENDPYKSTKKTKVQSEIS